MGISGNFLSWAARTSVHDVCRGNSNYTSCSWSFPCNLESSSGLSLTRGGDTPWLLPYRGATAGVAALRDRDYNWNRQPIFSDVVSSPALGSVRRPHSARRAWTV